MKNILFMGLLFLLSSCVSSRSNPFGPCVVNEVHKTASIGCVDEGRRCPLSKDKINKAHKNIVSYIHSEFGEYGKIFKESQMFSNKDINSGNSCSVYIHGTSSSFLHPEHIVYYSKKSLLVEKVYKVQW